MTAAIMAIMAESHDSSLQLSHVQVVGMIRAAAGEILLPDAINLRQLPISLLLLRSGHVTSRHGYHKRLAVVRAQHLLHLHALCRIPASLVDVLKLDGKLNQTTPVRTSSVRPVALRFPVLVAKPVLHDARAVRLLVSRCS